MEDKRVKENIKSVRLDMRYVCMLSCFSHIWLFGNPMYCSTPALSVHGIFQTRILEWIANPSSTGSSWPRDQTHVSCGSCIAGDSLPPCHLGKPWPDMYVFQIRVLHFQIKVFHWSLQPHWCLCKKASPVSLAFTQTFHLMVVYLEERPCIRIYAVIEKKLLWGSWLRKNEIPYLASVSMISQLDFATPSTEIFSKILGNSSKHSTQNSVSFPWFLQTKQHVISRNFWRRWL